MNGNYWIGGNNTSLLKNISKLDVFAVFGKGFESYYVKSVASHCRTMVHKIIIFS